MRILTLLFSALLLYSCNKEQSGCLNEWGSNYDPSASISCCCDFDTANIIDGIVGKQNFQDECQVNTYSYETEISKVNNTESKIKIKNFGIYKQDIYANFENGMFLIDQSFVLGGCNFNLTGTMVKEDGKLILSSTNKPDSGLCTNITELICVATSN